MILTTFKHFLKSKTFLPKQSIHNKIINTSNLRGELNWIDVNIQQIKQIYVNAKNNRSYQKIYFYFRMPISDKQIIEYLDPSRIYFSQMNIVGICQKLRKVELICNTELSYLITVLNYHKLLKNKLVKPLIIDIENEQILKKYYHLRTRQIYVKLLPSFMCQAQIKKLFHIFGEYEVLRYPISNNLKIKKIIFVKFKQVQNALQCYATLNYLKLEKGYLFTELTMASDNLKDCFQAEEYNVKQTQDSKLGTIRRPQRI